MNYRILSAAVFLLLTGCGQEQEKTYRVAKETAPVKPTQAPASSLAFRATAPSDFSATLPDGWSENSGSGMRKVSYSIEGSSVDFYLIVLGMGDVPSNVNRWRGQVGLSPATPEEILAETQTFSVDGREVNWSEVYNPESGMGIVAAIISNEDAFWFFTAKGSVDELKAHVAEIRKFVESVRFE